MAVTININDLTLCHKGSGGVAKSTVPDLCKTPPDAKPVNYVNVAESKDLAKGTTTVHADGGNMCANLGSEFSKSTGDEAGSLLGVLSGTHLAEATWITYSPDVYLEGAAACRLTDKMFLNHANSACMGGLYQLDLATDDPLLYALCQVFCETLEAMGEGANKKPGKYSEMAKKLGRGKYDNALNSAAKKALGKGSKVALERTAKVAVKKGLVDGTKRVAKSAAYLERKFRNSALKAAGGKLAKGAAKKVFLKFIPIVNVASTAWDIYELGSAAYDVSKSVASFMKNYDVFKIQPDAMFTGPNGNVTIYDYKFPGDSFANNPGQEDLYRAAGGGKKPKVVDKKACGDCKKKK